MTHIARNGLVAAGLLAAAGAAPAGPAAAQTVLAPNERVVVYRELAAQPYQPRRYVYSNSVPAYTDSRVYYRYTTAPRGRPFVGSVVPAGVRLNPVPETVAAPAVSDYTYTVVEERVVLVDPGISEFDEVFDPSDDG